MAVEDWSLPVETTEDPPRPVQILFDKAGNPDAARMVDSMATPAFNLFTLTQVGTDIRAERGMVSYLLRNVAPKPVRHEANVYLHSNGHVSLEDNPDSLNTVECHRIVWNSDGSPVEDDTVTLYYHEATIKDLIAERYRADALRQSEAEDRDRAEARAEKAEYLLEQMQAVVDAAMVVSDRYSATTLREMVGLHDAIYAYRRYEEQSK